MDPAVVSVKIVVLADNIYNVFMFPVVCGMLQGFMTLDIGYNLYTNRHYVCIIV